MVRNHRFPPGPVGNIIFGHFAEYSRDPLGFLSRCAREFGDVASFRLPGTRFYLLSNPEHIGKVFTSTNSEFINHGGMRMPLSRMLFGSGILTSEGDEWRRQRSLTFPSFRHSRVPEYAEIMIDETRRMLDSWKVGEPVEIFDEMTKLTLRTFMRTLLRSSKAGQSDEITKSFFALRDGFLLKGRLQSFGMLWRMPVKSRYRHAINRLDLVVDNIIHERRLETNSHDDLLSVLMSAEYKDGRPISEKQLRSEIKTFLFTGIFGAALPLGWAHYSISHNHGVGQRLSAETERLFSGDILSGPDLKKCEYARWIMKETLRLYPPIWASGREAIVDCEIDGFFVPKGTQIILSQWVTQRDSRFWSDPERFDPDRWALVNGRPKYAYFPHGGGPRFCMGDAFAELLSVIVLSMVTQRFSLRHVSDDAVGMIPSYALFPEGKVEVLVEKSEPPCVSGARKCPNLFISNGLDYV